MAYDDILYEATDGVAWITINRPNVLNAFRGRTVDELIHAFKSAWHDPGVGVCVLTGAGERAFSTGGDQAGGGGEADGRRGGLGPDMHRPHRGRAAVPEPVAA